ncbi:MAG TPA: hypothetical protein VGL22_09660 [Terracidiphilus sp.]
MAEVTIQFDAQPGTDMDALAQKLHAELAGLPSVDTVQAEVMDSRDATAIATTIMACIVMAPKIIDDATRIVNALKSLVQASDGLRSAIVEVRGRHIPVDKLQPSDLSAPNAAH